ncbi:pentatricopeptide repeat-containing protein At3g29290 [Salvia miltiorrhiza]|uniref:pentatricopeptide repeat-containing protein At3g29290 n=1 Tax=Salvia miltiorrhiza TaxID=226208 RepID=UPI0025ACED76|nr:pentatricopeptide repeat-containing protein At3g29290 [Salvia miltiorrhiza]XP_057769634.1 pentatricopeptide repeat-containing protein At3g29290 [Salvia miltiorrhiza]XP_057769635.1 pentatricopeptide repeat-containing protein At3g29290 [Salvia miltiorrhiza]
MAEVLSTSPACSVSIYSRIHDIRIPFRCINCSACFDWGWKMNINSVSAKNHGFGVAENSYLRTTPKQRGSFLLCKSKESEILCGIRSNVASLEFEPVCEGQKEGLDENGSQNILPPWGGLADQELDDRSCLDVRSTMPLEAVHESMDEIHYLEERDEEVLSQRILKLSRANKVRSALALYRSMAVSGLLPRSHACNSLLTCLLRDRRLDDALRVFEFMRSNEIVTGHTYSLILKAVADVWGRDVALTMFEEAERDGKTKRHMDAVVYNTMIAISGKVNDWVQAERMWRSLRDNACVGTAVTYCMLVCIFVRCGQNELALDAYHEMVQNGLSPNDDAMQAVIGACAREGKWDTALDILQSMLSNDMNPSLVTCNALINSLGKAAKVDLAFKVYDLLKSLGYAPDAYTWNGLLCALNRANRHSDALQLFESIRKEHGSVLNLHIYNTCLMSCQRLGLWDKAMQLLWEMEGAGFPISVTSYNLVIGACEAAKKPKVALQVYEHMVEQKRSPDVFTLLSLIRSCIWGSLWKDVEEILNAEPNGSLYNAAIQGSCLRKESDLAKRFYVKMREIGLKPDGKTRAMMLQNLPKC